MDEVGLDARLEQIADERAHLRQKKTALTDQQAPILEIVYRLTRELSAATEEHKVLSNQLSVIERQDVALELEQSALTAQRNGSA